ncbi:hypothetical protein [Enterobacter cloacae complex sp. 284J4]|uniref:hypothetical protein n=1 Tax=Enterobacter cloacae complex sp. 284J4 TaxID=3395851 RepID=UPI003CEEE5FA
MRALSNPLAPPGRGLGPGTSGGGGHSVHFMFLATLCQRSMTGERAASVRHHPGDPGSGGKSPLRGALGLFLPAYRVPAEATSL